MVWRAYVAMVNRPDSRLIICLPGSNPGPGPSQIFIPNTLCNDNKLQLKADGYQVAINLARRPDSGNIFAWDL